ncbi:MAG: TIGR04211 family SH3 domain-containing protein [Psychromonas sp.]
MKNIRYIIAALTLMLSVNVFAETRYVSDDVFIYMHSGPGQEYRIIGTINVGATVQTLKYNESTKYMQVRTSAGKTGWVKNQELQSTLPAKSMLPTVQKELQEAKTKLQNIEQENSQEVEQKVQSIVEKDDLIARLVSEKATLQESIIDLEARNLELDLLQDTKDERVKMEWMMYGGSVLFFGLLIGLLIPFLPRRKKKQDNW